MKKAPQIIYLTPADVIEKYPELFFKHNWSPNVIGSLLKSSLLKGYYDRSRRSSMIEETSVLELIEFINQKIESQKIKL